MRDIVLFGPTHYARELGLLLWDAGLLQGTVFIPSRTDVGSAKQKREHPPGFTGLNFALHGHAGLLKMNEDLLFVHFYFFINIYS